MKGITNNGNNNGNSRKSNCNFLYKIFWLIAFRVLVALWSDGRGVSLVSILYVVNVFIGMQSITKSNQHLHAHSLWLGDIASSVCEMEIVNGYVQPCPLCLKIVLLLKIETSCKPTWERSQHFRQVRVSKDCHVTWHIACD